VIDNHPTYWGFSRLTRHNRFLSQPNNILGHHLAQHEKKDKKAWFHDNAPVIQMSVIMLAPCQMMLQSLSPVWATDK
jgi:hypothetical protein